MASNQPCTMHTPATARTPRVCTLVPFIIVIGDVHGMLVVVHARCIVSGDIIIFMSVVVGIRQKICSRILHDVDVYMSSTMQEGSQKRQIFCCFSHPALPSLGRVCFPQFDVV